VTLDKELLIEGDCFSIYEIIRDGKNEIRDFLQSLKAWQPSHYLKVMKRLEIVSSFGPSKRQDKFRHEGDGIYAIKVSQVRLYCFFDQGRMILLAHGSIKKQNKARPEDLKKARDIKAAWMKSMGR